MKKIGLFLVAIIFMASFLYATSPHKPTTPIIVAKQSFTAQTGVISATTIYTPDVEGDYRLSLYIVGTTGTDEACGGFTWTDESPWSETANWACGFSAVNSAGRLTSVIHVAASTPIQFFTSISGANITYDAFVTVEQID